MTEEEYSMLHMFSFKKNINELTINSDNTISNKNKIGLLSITTLGIGAIIGAGIFTITGTAAAEYAGPGIVYSFMLAGVLCVLIGLCYAEFTAMIPISGSAYTYIYASMGECMAWIVGWLLFLSYTFGVSAIANGWSSYLISLCQTLGFKIPNCWYFYTKGPFELVTLNNSDEYFGVCNVPAVLIVLILSRFLNRDLKTNVKITTFIVIIKLAVILLFIIVGFNAISLDNIEIHQDGNVSSLSRLVPSKIFVTDVTGKIITKYGWGRGGILTASGVVFFSFLGFDSISTVTSEVRNCRINIPIGLFASLLICTALYVMTSIVLTGVIHYSHLSVSDPIALGIDRIINLYHLNSKTRVIFSFVIKIGALAGLTSVMIVIMMSNARILYAIAKDGLLPWFNKLDLKYNTPKLATNCSGILIAILSGLFPINTIVQATSLGQLLVFCLVCVGVIVFRIIQPNIKRPFKLSLPWLTASSALVGCLWLMIGFELKIWFYLMALLIFGFNIYAIYGRRHSLLQNRLQVLIYGSLNRDYLSTFIQTIGFVTLLRSETAFGIIFGTILLLFGLFLIFSNYKHKYVKE